MCVCVVCVCVCVCLLYENSIGYDMHNIWLINEERYVISTSMVLDHDLLVPMAHLYKGHALFNIIRTNIFPNILNL